MTPKTTAPLSEMETELLSAFVDTGTDIAISLLHGLLYPGVYRDAKTQQQYVGSIVSRINGKLVEHRVVPGEMKRTYRLKQV